VSYFLINFWSKNEDELERYHYSCPNWNCCYRSKNRRSRDRHPGAPPHHAVKASIGEENEPDARRLTAAHVTHLIWPAGDRVVVVHASAIAAAREPGKFSTMRSIEHIPTPNPKYEIGIVLSPAPPTTQHRPCGFTVLPSRNGTATSGGIYQTRHRWLHTKRLQLSCYFQLMRTWFGESSGLSQELVYL
jgi:hypothetical protein